MGTHLIPRDLKGEGRILTFFSYKALIYTVIGVIIGYVLRVILSLINLSKIGLGIMIFLGVFGFAIGTLKMPNTSGFEITRKTGGEKVDEILLRLIKFKSKKNRIYIYKEERKK